MREHVFFAALLTEVLAFAFLSWWNWPLVQKWWFQEVDAVQTIPKVINYQARITDSAGVPVPDGALNVKFAIYDAASGGTCLYVARGSCGTPTSKSVTVSNGNFSTLIGDTGDNAIPDNLFDNNTLYLGLTVGTDAEMSPRKRIGASGYAFNADRLDNLDTSSSGGAAAYVPVTDSSGNLIITGNVGLGNASPSFTVDASSTTGIRVVGPSTTGLTFKSNIASSDFMGIRWRNSANAVRWSMGNDFNGNTNQDFWLYDNANGKTVLLADQSGTGYLSFGTTSGGFQYDNVAQDLTWFVNGSNKLDLNSSGYLGVGDLTPAALLTVGNGDLFQVDTNGNLVRINNVGYSWPSSQGGAGTVLTNSGSGTLTWSASGATTSLNQAYNNATGTPQISLNGTNGLLRISDTVGGLGTDLLEITNRTAANAYTTKYFTVSSTSTQVAANSSNGAFIVSQAGSGASVFLNSTAPKFDIADTGTLTFRDGSNTLASIVDDGTKGSLKVTNNFFMGSGTAIAANSVNSMAVGNGASVTNPLSNTDSSIALGKSASACCTSAAAIGQSSLANGDNDIAIGHGATSNGTDSIALGTGGTQSNGTNAIAIGKDVLAGGIKGVVIGSGISSGSRLTTNVTGVTAFGFNLTTPTLYLRGGGTYTDNLVNTTAGSTAVIGNGANFTTAYLPGDKINAGGETRIVTVVTDSNHLTVDRPFTSTNSNVTNTIIPMLGQFLDRTDTPRLTIGPDGDVGVGTITPYARLVAADASVTPGSDIFEVLNAGSTRYFTVSSTTTHVLNNLVVDGTCTGCGGGSSSLNDAYIAATGTPQISLNGTNGLLRISDTVGGLGTNLLEVANRNGADAYTAKYFSVSATSTAIGNAAPTTLLSVGSAPATALNGNELFQIGNTGNADVYATIAGSGGLRMAYGILNAVGDGVGGFVGTQSNNRFNIRTNNLERLAIDTAGNVSIGTQVSTARLVVADGSVSPTNNIFQVTNANDSSRYLTVSSTSTHVYGDLTIDGTCTGCGGGSSTLQGAYTGSTSPELTLDATRGALTIRDAGTAVGNLLEIQNNNNSTPYFTVSSTSTYFAGNVGIGDPAPLYPLQVTVNDAVTNGPSTAAQFSHATTGTAANGIDTRILLTGEASNGSQWREAEIHGILTSVSSPVTGALAFYTRTDDSNVTEKMRIDSSGYVGIGTSSPGVALDVNGSLAIASGQVIYVNRIGAPNANINEGWGMQLNGDSTHPVQVLNTALLVGYDQTSGVSQNSGNLLISGNVGVGDTTPASALTVGNGDLFQVNSSGNIVKINNVTYSWPASQAASSGYVLANDGSGNLSWAAGGGGSSTLQGAYTNSTSPELTLDATRGALTVRDASSPVGNLLELQNNSRSISYFTVSSTSTLSNIPLTVNGLTTLNSAATDGYTVSSITYSPATLDASATPVTLGDDGASSAITVPFSFQLFGTIESTAYIGSNGYVCFGTNANCGASAPQNIPNASTPNGAVYGFWRDLNPGAGGTVKYETLGSAPNRTFIVEFNNVPCYSGCASTATFQIILYEGTNVVEIHTTNAPSATATQGIENSAGTLAAYLTGRNDATFSLTNDAVRFTPTATPTSLYATSNVGIGTSTPASLLTVRKDVSGGRGGEISIVNGAGGAGAEAALDFGVDSSSYNIDNANAQIKALNTSGSTNATDLVFSTWSGSDFGERMRVRADGNVGIGTASPAARLTIRDGSISPTTNIFQISNAADAVRYFTVSSTSTLSNVPLTVNGLTTLNSNASADGYAVSSITYNSATLDASATPVSLGDDAPSAAIALPFPFQLFGRTERAVYIAPNGYLCFETNAGCSAYAIQNIPNATTPNGAIYGFWRDLNPGAGGTVKYETLGTAPNRTFVVEFNGVPCVGSCASTVTFQIILYEGTNVVEIHAANAPSSTATQGIENSDGTLAAYLTGRNDATFSLTNDAVRFTPAPAVALYAIGNVGIGTSTPASLLTVRKDLSGVRGGEISIVNGAGGAGAEAALDFGVDSSSYNGDSGNAQIKALNMSGSTNATDLVFSTWSGSDFGERMRVRADGNVGIGTASPAARLTVSASGSSPTDSIFQVTNSGASASYFTVSSTSTLSNEPFIVKGLTTLDSNASTAGYTVSNITYSPVTLDAGATSVSLGDDAVSSAITMPFSFQFFGVTQNTAYIGSNGFVCFGSSTNCSSNTPQSIPSASAPNGAIYGFWHDLVPGGGGTVKYETFGSEAHRKFVVEFNNVPCYSGCAAGNVTFQIIVYEGTNIVEIHALNGPNALATQGIEDANGTVAAYVSGRNDATFSLSNDGVRFTPTTATSLYAIGNVGIGTSSPGSGLTVRKDQAGERGGEISIVNGGGDVGAEAALNFGVDSSSYNIDNANAQIKAVNTSGSSTNMTDLVFSTWSGSDFGERMRVRADGSVGIGTTSPNVPLAVGAATLFSPLTDVLVSASRNGSGQNAFFLASTDTSGEDAGIIIGTRQVGEDSAIFMDQSDARKLKFTLGTVGDDSGRTTNTKMTITQGGSVGIGTTGPLSKLDVSGGIAVGSYAGANAAPSNGIIVSGNVGIGNNNPESALHVTGSIDISPNSTSYNEGVRIHASTNDDYSAIVLGAVSGSTGTGAGQWNLIRYPSAGFSNQFGLRYSTNGESNGHDFLNVSTGGNVSINNGNLGVGWYTPAARLVVADAAASPTNNIFQVTNANDSTRYLTVNSTSTYIAGDLGIGTASPAKTLEVAGQQKITYNNGTVDSAHAALLIENASLGQSIIDFTHGGTEKASIRSDSTGNLVANATSNYFYLQPDFGSGTPYIIPGRGAVGFKLGITPSVGACTADQVLTVCGDASKSTGGTSWVVTSDARTKEDIQPFTDGLDVALRIDPRTFKYNGLGGTQYTGRTEYGVVAQELLPVAPYMIDTISGKLHPDDATNTEMYRLVNADAFPLIAINAIKELHAMIVASASGTDQFAIQADSIIDFKRSTVTGLASIISSSGNWSMTDDGYLVAKQVEAETVKAQTLEVVQTDQTQTVGSGTVPAGYDAVVIHNPAMTADAEVFLSFHGNPGSASWVAEKGDGDFTVHLSLPAPSDAEFAYWIIPLEDRRTPLDTSASSTDQTTDSGSSTPPVDSGSSTSPVDSGSGTTQTSP